jgi:alginate O-acetyltransferase complex protein AlgJ
MSSTTARWLIAAGCAAVLAVPAFRASQPAAGPFARFAAALGEVGRERRENGWLAADHALLARMDELERDLERDSVLLRAALPTVQRLLVASGAGNEKVYLGRDGWLFLRPGVDYVTGPPFLDPAVLARRARSGESWEQPPQPDPLAAILDFHRQLDRRGIALLVLPAPTKAMVYPERLRPGTTADESLHNPSFAAFRAELERHGIEVFDPLPALLAAKRNGTEDVFLRTDSHWSPAGLDAVAAALAERLRALGLAPAAGTGPPAARRAAVVHRGVGDLARMLELPAGWAAPESVRLRRVVGTSSRSREPAILLLGDSFSNVFSLEHLGWGTGAGLAEQLAFELGEGVDRLAVDAGGAWSSRRKLAGDAGRLAGKRLVIYQFAVRELAVGDWKMIELSG